MYRISLPTSASYILMSKVAFRVNNSPCSIALNGLACSRLVVLSVGMFNRIDYNT
jgi:hypothetical protein